MKTRTTILAFACIAALSFAGGCGAASASTMTLEQEKAVAQHYPSLQSGWKDLLQNEDLSDFERGVLERAVETGVIAQNDYERGHAQYMQCMTDAGYDQLIYTKMPDGLYQLSSKSRTDANYFNQSVQCSDGTTRVIEAAYRDQQDNPERYKDAGILAAQCLRDAGIVDDTYTAAQFNESAKQLNTGEENISSVFGFP